MKKLVLSITTCLLATFSPVITVMAQNSDEKTYANYERYAEANKSVDSPVAVFMGNSIFDNWNWMNKKFFTENNYEDRGISGQVTAQMLARFRSDVIDLMPKVVVILAGTNDIAQNNMYMPIEKIAENIFSMVELSKANNIIPIICSVLPAASYPWRTEITDVPKKIKAVNALLQEYAQKNSVTYINLFDKMKDENDGLPKALSKDGVHPTVDGYAIMASEIIPVISRLAGK